MHSLVNSLFSILVLSSYKHLVNDCSSTYDLDPALRPIMPSDLKELGEKFSELKIDRVLTLARFKTITNQIDKLLNRIEKIKRKQGAVENLATKPHTSLSNMTGSLKESLILCGIVCKTHADTFASYRLPMIYWLVSVLSKWKLILNEDQLKAAKPLPGLVVQETVWKLFLAKWNGEAVVVLLFKHLKLD